MRRPPPPQRTNCPNPHIHVATSLSGAPSSPRSTWWRAITKSPYTRQTYWRRPSPRLSGFSNSSGCPSASKNAAQMFQRLMDNVTSQLRGVFVYLDDVLVASMSAAQHERDLRHLFDALRCFGLVLNVNKCVFGACELEFLGHHVSAIGISPLPEKVEAVQRSRGLCHRWPPPAPQILQPPHKFRRSYHSAYDLELLAIYSTIIKFRHMLEGWKFQILTDQKHADEHVLQGSGPHFQSATASTRLHQRVCNGHRPRPRPGKRRGKRTLPSIRWWKRIGNRSLDSSHAIWHRLAELARAQCPLAEEPASSLRPENVRFPGIDLPVVCGHVTWTTSSPGPRSSTTTYLQLDPRFGPPVW